MKSSEPRFAPKDKDRSPADAGVEMDHYAIKGRIWIEGPHGTFLGYGRAVLLERIGEYGSISKAARSMGMSYRHAWELVDSMNRNAPAPLVITATGGRGGGGARLTEAGHEAIRLFWAVYEGFEGFLEGAKGLVDGLHLDEDSAVKGTDGR